MGRSTSASAEETSTDNTARIRARSTSSDTASKAFSIRLCTSTDLKRPISRRGQSVLAAQRTGATPTRPANAFANGMGEETNDAHNKTPQTRLGALAATEMAIGPEKDSPTTTQD